jgi:drug/metabolite transporter (DMT)-like permease
MKIIHINDQILRNDSIRQTLLPLALGLMTAFLWALIETLGALLPSGYSPYQTVWVRYGVHLGFLGLVGLLLRKKGLVKTRHWKAQILRGLLMLGMPLSFIFAVSRMPANDVWDIFWLAPLFAMGLSSLFLKEHSQKRAWFAAGMIVIASVLIMSPSLPISLKGMVFTLGVLICFSLYMLGTRLLATEDTLTSLFYTAAVVFVPLTILMPFVWKELTPSAFLIMALIGLAGFGLLFSLDRVLEKTTIGRIAPLLASEPAWFVLLNSILFRTPLHLRDAAACLLILAAGSWAYFSGSDIHYLP